MTTRALDRRIAGAGGRRVGLEVAADTALVLGRFGREHGAAVGVSMAHAAAEVDLGAFALVVAVGAGDL